MGVVGLISLFTSAATKIGLEIGKTIAENLNIENCIKESIYSNPDPQIIPSPSIDYIDSPLDTGDIINPLETLLNFQLKLSILILIFSLLFLIFSLLFFVFSKFVINNNFDFVKKILPSLIFDKYINILKRSNDIKNKFLLVMLSINILIIIILLIMSIFVSMELINNTDGYVNVYNHIHDKFK